MSEFELEKRVWQMREISKCKVCGNHSTFFINYKDWDVLVEIEKLWKSKTQILVKSIIWKGNIESVVCWSCWNDFWIVNPFREKNKKEIKEKNIKEMKCLDCNTNILNNDDLHWLKFIAKVSDLKVRYIFAPDSWEVLWEEAKSFKLIKNIMCPIHNTWYI